MRETKNKIILVKYSDGTIVYGKGWRLEPSQQVNFVCSNHANDIYKYFVKWIIERNTSNKQVISTSLE